MRKIILLLLCALSLSSIEAQQRKATEKKVTIRDIFLALPDDALENRWTVEERKELLKQIGCPKDKENGVPPFIDVCDERRGYLRVYYAYPESRRVEVCYWNLKDGRYLKQCRYIIFHWKNERWTKEVKTLPAIDQDEDCQCL